MVSLTPTIMSWKDTVVAGVSTIHDAMTTTVTSFAANPNISPAAIELAKAIAEGAKGGAIGGAATFTAQGMASALTPTIMSYTGTVVAGVGMMHSVMTVAVISFAANPIVALAAFGVGAIGGGWYYGYHRLRSPLSE